MLPDSYVVALLLRLREGGDLDRLKRELAPLHGVLHIPSNIEILMHLDGEELAFAKPLLLTKPMRSRSGVTVVAIMTRPSKCPHGRCTYCPGGLKSHFGDVPQSYTGHEPASMRGARADYDAYVQVFNRLEQYVVTGHDVQKAELILMGGTFPNEGAEYQNGFVTDAFRALNDFSRRFFLDGSLDVQSFREFFSLPGNVHDAERTARVKRRILDEKECRSATLEAAQEENETAYVRCVGLTIETRPSTTMREEGERMLLQGCTRVELGIQTTFDDVLAAVHRGHTLQDSIDSIATLRDLGFKLNFHLMLGLPLMTRERDREAARRLFADPAFRPDMLKIYPCMVMPGTPLHRDYEAGRFTPMTTEEAALMIAEMLPTVPRYCRVMRVQRDIPTKVTAAGVDRTNLRQLVDERLAAAEARSEDVRAREIGDREIREVELRVIDYAAAGGQELFISLDEPRHDAIIGFCRLRIPPRALRKELVGAAILRELHVYGRAKLLGVPGAEKDAQHRGYGRRLLAEAERLATERGCVRIAVISGVGAREYYRRLGYVRDGSYMVKDLGTPPVLPRVCTDRSARAPRRRC